MSHPALHVGRFRVSAVISTGILAAIPAGLNGVQPFPERRVETPNETPVILTRTGARRITLEPRKTSSPLHLSNKRPGCVRGPNPSLVACCVKGEPAAVTDPIPPFPLPPVPPSLLRSPPTGPRCGPGRSEGLMPGHQYLFRILLTWIIKRSRCRELSGGGVPCMFTGPTLPSAEVSAAYGLLWVAVGARSRSSPRRQVRFPTSAKFRSLPLAHGQIAARLRVLIAG